MPSDFCRYDENTLRKVYAALAVCGVTIALAQDIVNEMQNRGILFRERQTDDELNERIDQLHGPGAAAALDRAIAEGHFGKVSDD